MPPAVPPISTRPPSRVPAGKDRRLKLRSNTARREPPYERRCVFESYCE